MYVRTVYTYMYIRVCVYIYVCMYVEEAAISQITGSYFWWWRGEVTPHGTNADNLLSDCDDMIKHGPHG